jgi:hypothetical protein
MMQIFKKILIYSFLTFSFVIASAALLLHIYQQDIIYLATTRINKILNTKVEVNKNIELSILKNFPHLTIVFHNVKIYEPNPQITEPFADISELALNFNIYDIYHKNYTIQNLSIENGYIQLRTDSTGNHNFDILKDDTSSSEKNFFLKNISIKNIDLLYDHQPSRFFTQLFIKNTQSSLAATQKKYQLTVVGDIYSKIITIDNQKFLTAKNAHLNTSIQIDVNKSIIIPKNTLLIENTKYEFESTYLFEEQQIDLTFNAAQSNIYTLAALLPSQYQKELYKYKSNGNIFFKGNIKGEVKKPSIQIDFGFNNATFTEPTTKIKIEKATLIGSYNNGIKNNSSTTTISLQNIQATVNNHTIKGDFKLNNLDNPTLDFNLNGTLDLALLNTFLKNKNITTLSGFVDCDVSFKGLLQDLNNKKTFDKINAHGDIQAHNINVQFNQYPYPIKIEKGACSFNKNDVAVNDFQFEIKNNVFLLDGMFRNLIGKIIYPERPMYIEASAVSEEINLDELLSSEQRIKGEVNDFALPLLKDYHMDLNLKAKSLHYNKVNAKNISTDVSWHFPLLKLNNHKTNICNGSLTGNTTIKMLDARNLEISTDSKLNNISIDSLFHDFDDFGQDFIRYKNLKGKLNCDISLLFKLNEHLKIAENSLMCDADFSITNGELIQFEPLQKISRFVDGSNLARVQFSELKNHLLIYNEKINIPEMYIKSNIGNLGIAGTHHFDGKIDYHITYPLNNLRKEKIDPDAAFGAIRPDNKGESKLFLILTGTTDNFKITYDKQKTEVKIKNDLKKEKEELISIFKKKETEVKQTETKKTEEEYFDFDE